MNKYLPPISDHLFKVPSSTMDDPLSVFCAYDGHGYPLPCHRASEDHRFKTQGELDAYFADVLAWAQKVSS